MEVGLLDHTAVHWVNDFTTVDKLCLAHDWVVSAAHVVCS